MSDTATSGDATVAPAENVSAPPAPAPTFGNSRGSGLSRGKRANASTPATTQNTAAPGEYQPTAVQVIVSEREYKNPFAPEPAPAPAAKVEQPVATAPTKTVSVDAPAPAPETLPAATLENLQAAPSSRPATEPAAKPELKILPPEATTRAAQSWEIGSTEEPAPAPTRSQQSRRDDRPTFRPERRENRPDFRTASNEGRRDPQPQSQQPRERRTFQPKSSVPTIDEKKSGGLIGWLKGLFSGGETETTPPMPVARSDSRSGDNRRFQEGQQRGGGRRHHRGGRGRDGFRGENRGPQNGPSGGPSSGGEQPNGERRFDGGQRGGGRRHHRGGRGRGGSGGGNYRGGDQRSDGGNGPASS